MRERGYRSKGTRLWRKAESGNLLTIQLRRSQSSTRDKVSVAVDYGVYSAVLGTLYDDEPETLDVWRAHLRDRVCVGRTDEWLVFSTGDPLDTGSEELRRRCEVADQSLVRFASDEALRDEWLDGHPHGLTPLQHGLFLAILVSRLGPADQLERVVKQLRESPAYRTHRAVIELELSKARIGR
jgi:hypothetical protein